jgi:hypothetical protein
MARAPAAASDLMPLQVCCMQQRATYATTRDALPRQTARSALLRLSSPRGSDEQYHCPGDRCANHKQAQQAQDGYTLLMSSTANAINATLYERLNFNFIRDLRSWSRPTMRGRGIPLRSPVSAHRDQPLCAKCRHVAAFRGRSASIRVRDGLAGWGGRTRTCECYLRSARRPAQIRWA